MHLLFGPFCGFGFGFGQGLWNGPRSMLSIFQGYTDMKTSRYTPTVEFAIIWTNFLKNIEVRNIFDIAIKVKFHSELSITVNCKRLYCPSCNNDNVISLGIKTTIVMDDK